MNKYIAYSRELTIFVTAYGRQEAVRFHDMGQASGQSVFATNDPVLASAIERHPRFGTMFYLSEGDLNKVDEPEEEKHVYEKVYDYVTRTQAAIEVLVKDYDVKRSEVKTKQDVLRKAFELNISFPKLEK